MSPALEGIDAVIFDLDGVVTQAAKVHAAAWREAFRLAGKPAPDTFQHAAKLLGVAPARAAVLEDALAGVAAARAGGFRTVIGVDRAGQAEALRAHGATVVVRDLGELGLA